MATLVSRPPKPRGPRRPPAAPPPRPSSVTVAGLAAALQAAALGVLAVMVVVLVGWATAPDGAASAGTAVTAGLQAWLLANHTRLLVPGGAFSLAPLAASLLPLVLVHTATLRAARGAQVSGRRGAVALASAVTAGYAGVCTAVALLARTDAVQPLPLSAFLGAMTLAAAASASAVLRVPGSVAGMVERLPMSGRTAAAPAGAAVCTLVGCGALLVAVSLARHHEQGAMLVAALDPGVGGSLLLLLGSVLYVPTAAVWGTAYAVGPGFAVGTGTSVSVAGADLGAVPTFPLLSALPETPDAGAGLVALAAPVLAGVLAALLLRRAADAGADPGPEATTAGHQSGRQAELPQLLRSSALVGLLVGLVLALLAAVASGSAGAGRMAEVGPRWWAVGAASGVEVAVVTALTLLALRYRTSRPG